MSVAMAIFSCAVGSDALLRHWEYFKRQEADRYHVILTEDARCHAPAGVHTIVIGKDCYIDGDHLPRRLLDTIERMLFDPWSSLILSEYDCIHLRPLPAEKVLTIAGHLGGGRVWQSKAEHFYHPPHIFSRDCAIRFLTAGRKALADGICPPRQRGGSSTPECSTDVFLGYVCQTEHIPVQTDLWSEFSRNSFDLPGDLERARESYQNGIDVIHGIKHAKELEFISS